MDKNIQKRGYKNHRSPNKGDITLALILVSIIGMPLVGIYLMLQKDERSMIFGTVIFVLGAFLWMLALN